RPCQRARSLSSGPPWMLTKTGRGPVNCADGRYRTPEMTVPSKLFHSTTSGGGSTSGLNVVSLMVHRVTVPSDASSEYTSPYVLTDASVKPSSRDPGRQRSCETTPCIGSGTVRAFSVVVSTSCSSLVDPLSTTTASSVPSGESA